MAREVNRLSARRVQTLTEPGRHSDGNGLYLVIEPSGSRRWALLYRMNGKRREMGLGGARAVSLQKARELAAEAKANIQARIDPIQARASTANIKETVTFADVAETYMADRETIWRNAAHRRQWRQTLEVQAASIWKMPVAEIGTDDVLDVLRPLWHKKPETARRLRGRIEKVLSAAIAQGLRDGPNPALWPSHLDAILPRPKKLVRGHHPAMPYVKLPDFFLELERTSAPASAPLQFLILTAARSGEVRGMVWKEIDIDTKVWIRPADRMKGKREHRVPLSMAAMKVLDRQLKGSPNDLVFPSLRGREMSDMIFNMLLRRMKQEAVTTHGFRSSFRDWVNEETDISAEIAEEALAHRVGNETERAYRRGDALERRRHLMDRWAEFVTRSISEREISVTPPNFDALMLPS